MRLILQTRLVHLSRALPQRRKDWVDAAETPNGSIRDADPFSLQLPASDTPAGIKSCRLGPSYGVPSCAHPVRRVMANLPMGRSLLLFFKMKHSISSARLAPVLHELCRAKIRTRGRELLPRTTAMHLVVLAKP